MDDHVKRFDRASLSQLQCVTVSYSCSIRAPTPFACRSNEPLPDYTNEYMCMRACVHVCMCACVHVCMWMYIVASEVNFQTFLHNDHIL